MDASAGFSLFLQVDLVDYVLKTTPIGKVVLVTLFIFSVSSWTIIFSKWSALSKARASNARFLRAFRKANGLEAVMVASEQFRPSPLVSVFDFGYAEINRQVQTRGGFNNKAALERSLQLGVNEELARLEHNLNWLATTASVSPFIGLFGTVLGIIKAFEMLGSSGGTSLASVGPGISEALFATAVGLFAAIPAAVFYNHFGHMLKELAARMDDFSLEFINLAERSFGE
ncbi:MAG TPA: MotA/TolQ/ExbB proton channel family protein [Bryobacteraceae bacterium]